MRYIDAEVIPKLFDEKFKETRELIMQGENHLDNLAEGFTEADRVIRNIPTADVVEVRHGYWGTDKYGLERSICSICGAVYEGDGGNYCPNCGAKMDGERSENGNK